MLLLLILLGLIPAILLPYNGHDTCTPGFVSAGRVPSSYLTSTSTSNCDSDSTTLFTAPTSAQTASDHTVFTLSVPVPVQASRFKNQTRGLDAITFVNGTFADIADGAVGRVARVSEVQGNDGAVPIGIYICQYPNWTGTCFWTQIFPSMYNHCMVIVAGGGWASLGPDGGIAVNLYRDSLCRDMFWKDLTFPGDSDASARIANAGLAPVESDLIGAVFRAQDVT